MQRLGRRDFIKRLQHSGVADKVTASEVLEAMRLYIQSEFPDEQHRITPVAWRSGYIVVCCHNSTLADQLQQRSADICQFVHSATGRTAQGLKFVL